jgi:hypothetical protein
MIIRVLGGLSSSEKEIVFSQPAKLNDFISRKHFEASQNEVADILSNAMSNVHRLPIIIQPVIESLKDEITKRLKLI